MGLKPSPYFVMRAFHSAFELVTGDPADPRNVLHWSKIIFNLPGQQNYALTKPQLWKFNPTTNTLAAASLVYVDDLQTLGGSWEESWKVGIKYPLTFPT
jgi:hypothetical protein